MYHFDTLGFWLPSMDSDLIPSSSTRGRQLIVIPDPDISDPGTEFTTDVEDKRNHDDALDQSDLSSDEDDIPLSHLTQHGTSW
jgi:hypothetical protein